MAKRIAEPSDGPLLRRRIIEESRFMVLHGQRNRQFK
jgi:hypothetical protein